MRKNQVAAIGFAAESDVALSSQVPFSSSAPSPAFRLELFGGFSCRVHGQPIPPLRTRHTAFLLALLALRYGRPAERASLAAALWPRQDAESGRAYLRRALMDLRTVLGPQAGRIQTPSRQTILLDLTDAVDSADSADAADGGADGAFFDVHLFDLALAAGGRGDLDRAIALYRGPLMLELEEVDDPDGGLHGERERRANQFREALQKRALLRREEGDFAGGITDLRRLTALDPTNEPFSLLLMRALAEAKDRAGAVAEYERLRDQLSRDLGMEPEPETAAFAEALQSLSASDSDTAAAYPAAMSEKAAPTSVPEPIVTVLGLPVPVTRFFGRGMELQRLREWIVGSGPDARRRLITVTGPPGIGKTRLAIEAVRGGAAAEPKEVRAVWFITLADARDPAVARVSLGRALGLTGAKAEDLDAIALALSGTDARETRIGLLVLDNLEHLLPELSHAEAAAAIGGDVTVGSPAEEENFALFVHRLLSAVPTLACLVTSRRPLLITGEQEMRLGTLPFPAADAGATQGEGLSEYAAVALFVDRARLADAEFAGFSGDGDGAAGAADASGASGRETRVAIAALCRALEGLPLSLEMAAARLRGGQRTVKQILGEISERQVALQAVLYDLPPRQRSLYAAIDWSYGLLSAAEQALLARLSVFVGGWTLPAAAAVGGFAPPVAPDEVSALLKRLVQHSLVLVDQVDTVDTEDDNAMGGTEASAIGSPRYGMLESIREYAARKLEEQVGTAASARTAHRDWYRALAWEGGGKIAAGATQMEWLSRFETEHNNLRAALDWCESLRAAKGDFPGTGASAYRDTHEDTFAGERKTLVEMTSSLGMFWHFRGYFAEGRARISRALDWLPRTCTGAVDLKQIDQIPGLGDGGDDEAADADGRPKDSMKMLVASSLNYLGILSFSQGDAETARSYMEDSLSLFRTLQSRENLIRLLGNAGALACLTGDYALARSRLEEALSMARENSDRLPVAATLTNLGDAVTKQGDYATARTYLNEAVAVFREVGEKHGIAMSLNNLGEVEIDTGNADAARDCFAEALQLRQTIGDRRGITFSLTGLAYAALADDVARAAALMGAASALRDSIQVKFGAYDQARWDRKLAQARDFADRSVHTGVSPAMSNGAFETAWNEGRVMDWDEAVRYALAELSPS